MKRQMHLWQEEAVVADGAVTVGVTLELANQKQTRLWYRLPESCQESIAPSCDPYIIATILLSMKQGADVQIHGEVSPSLLQNLSEFQAAWQCWRPQVYRAVDITAEVEREQPSPPVPEGAISAFSGGVDSCFTVFRHRTGRCGRWQQDLQAAVMVRGFDIPLDQPQVFDRAFVKSQATLSSLGVKLIPVATNFKELPLQWEDSFGTGVASTLMLFQRQYSAGLIASASPYQSLRFPWGSNPLTDPLLSTQAFRIVHDGTSCDRLEKIKGISQWPEALQNLRVCWQGQQLDRNCGRCEKCIRTILIFRALGLGLPSCFEQDVTDRQILEVKGLKKSHVLIQLQPIVEAARASGIEASWVDALSTCIQRNLRQARLNTYKETLKARLPEPIIKEIQQVRSRLSRR